MSKPKVNLMVITVLIICIAAMLLQGSNFFEDATSEAALKKEAKNVIQKLVGGSEQGLKEADASMYEEALDQKLTAFENEDYMFLYNDEKMFLEMAILYNDAAAPLFPEIKSEAQAVKILETIYSKVIPEFFTFKTYDVFCTKYDKSGGTSYTVEMWEKISDNFYTGNQLALILNERGQLELLVARNSGSDEKVQQCAAGKSISMVVTQEEAVHLAYDAIKGALNVSEQNNTLPPKTGNDIVMTDSGKVAQTGVVQEVDEVKIDERENHIINAYRQLEKGKVEWVIQISEIETNRNKNISFIVKIDAQSGAVVNIDHTR